MKTTLATLGVVVGLVAMGQVYCAVVVAMVAATKALACRGE